MTSLFIFSCYELGQDFPFFFFFFLLVLLSFCSRIIYLHEVWSREGKKKRVCVNCGSLWNHKGVCNQKLAGSGMRLGVMEEHGGKVAKREGAGKEPALN